MRPIREEAQEGLTREEAQEARARLIGAVREEFRDGAPQITDEQVWEAWCRTSQEMVDLSASDDPLARFVPRWPDGKILVSASMVAMTLLCDGIEGRI